MKCVRTVGIIYFFNKITDFYLIMFVITITKTVEIHSTKTSNGSNIYMDHSVYRIWTDF